MTNQYHPENDAVNDLAYKHPMRQAELHTFKRSNHSGKGAKWIARFYPYDTYAIMFNGISEADVIARAETFRTEIVEKNEAVYNDRRERLAKARAVRAAKEEPKT